MRIRHIATVLALMLAGTRVEAADAPVPPAEPARELLKPPTVEIPSPITDRFSLRGSFSFGKVSTEVRYDQAPGVLGTNFFAEKLLGLNDSQRVGGFEMMIRMGDRNRLRVDYFKLTRQGDVVLNQPVVLGPNTYLISDELVTNLDLRMLGLTYTYSFVKTDRFELGGGMGVHLSQAQGEADVPARQLRNTFDTVAPVPTLALDGTWRIDRHFSLNARTQYVAVHTSGVDGSFGIYHADVQYRAWRNLAFGAGYAKTHFLINSANPGNTGRGDLQVKGPELFVRASF
jgi:hypothetical protein